MEFDIESAKLAILCETGRIVTRTGKLIDITKIKIDPGEPIYPIFGRISGMLGKFTWTIEGKYFADEQKSEFDLFIDTDFDI